MISAFKYGLHYFNTLEFDKLKVSDLDPPNVAIHADQGTLVINTDYTIEISGNDSAGEIIIDFKNAKTPALGNLCVVTFTKPFKNVPHLFISNTSAVDLGFSVFENTISTFHVRLAAGTLTSEMNISFTYLCIESA